MTKIFIKPKEGLIVRNFQRPDLRPLKAEGEQVEDHPQWRRYLKTGDVIKTKPSKAKAKGDKE